MSNRTPKHADRRISKKFEGDTLTEQHHTENVKIQNIMKRYRETGVLTHVRQYQGTYENFIDAPDYQEAMNKIAEANSMFETVPSHIRLDFDNDPGKFIAFMQNPDNRTQIEAYGLDASHLGGNEEIQNKTLQEAVPAPSSDTVVDGGQGSAAPPPAAEVA